MLEYSYKCVRCGNCCRAGFEIRIGKEDILNWIQVEKTNILQHIQIEPLSISVDGLVGYHIEVDHIQEIKEKFSEENIKILTEFILKNHNYHGESIIPLPIYTFLPGMERRPILTPKNFQIILEGLKLGLIYILRFNYMTCPFLEDNLCSIHEIKPQECRAFPYNKEGKLKVDDYTLKICKGIK